MKKLTLLTLAIFFHLDASLASDPLFGTCPSKSCGQVEITYPFRIIGQQNKYCGYPGFEVSCENGNIPLVNISGNPYVIEQIWYANQSFQVRNSVFRKVTGSNCWGSIRNLTLEDAVFQFARNYTQIALFLNCPQKNLQEYKHDLLKCGTLALYKNDPKTRVLAGICGEVVYVPFQGDRGSNLTEVLNRGIVLNWTANNCTACVHSGGQCGFDLQTKEPKCFCSDRAHAYHCLPTLNPFHACKPKKCGELSISYPFYIEDQQEPFCGYQGFQVTCNSKNETVINLSDDTYVVEDTFYGNQSVHIVNTAFLDDAFNCSPVIHNLTLEGRFKFAFNHSEVIFLQNCTKDAEKSLAKFTEFSCAVGEGRRQVLAAYKSDSIFRDLAGKCGKVVLAPYERQGGSDIGVLRNGLVLQWTAANCNNGCVQSGGRYVYNSTTSQAQCFCSYGASDKCHIRNKQLGLIIGLVIAGIIILLVALLICWYLKKAKFIRPRSVSRSASLERTSSDIEKGNIYFGVPLFSYMELVEATGNFDHSRELGDGGFGTVYYGKLRDGREVAVKRLYEKSYKRVEQFMNEVQILTCLRHLNLVSLYGCTSHHSRELLLVYEYVPNGTVADHLYGDKAKTGSLPWDIRLRIAIGTASALSYLHTSDIIHRDVKTNNILLDSNFGVKVADFGLSRLFPNDVTHVSTAPQGTPGYLDPEYHQCYQLTTKSDVYSFGVVLIELISSLPAVDMNRSRQEINLSTYAMNRIQRCAFDELVDPGLGFMSDFKVRKMTTSVAELAFQCLQLDKEFRPSMDEVLETLNRIESADYEALKAEEGTQSDEVETSTKPPHSPMQSDAAKLLANHQLHRSPISVMDQWDSRSTTSTSK